MTKIRVRGKVLKMGKSTLQDADTPMQTRPTKIRSKK